MIHRQVPVNQRFRWDRKGGCWFGNRSVSGLKASSMGDAPSQDQRRSVHLANAQPVWMGLQGLGGLRRPHSGAPGAAADRGQARSTVADRRAWAIMGKWLGRHNIR